MRQPECVLDEFVYDGVVCSPDVQIRRIAFTGYTPDTFRGMPMNILKFDYATINAFSTPDAKLAYINDKTQYSDIFFKEKLGFKWDKINRIFRIGSLFANQDTI